MKTLEKVYQAPDKTIKIGSRDITPAIIWGAGGKVKEV